MSALKKAELAFVMMAKDFHKTHGCRGAEYFDTCTSEMCMAANFMETCCCSEEAGDNETCPVHNSTATLYRQDKSTKEIFVFTDGDSAVEQYMQDFGVKTLKTAQADLFELLTDPGIYFIQNVKVAWVRSLSRLAVQHAN